MTETIQQRPPRTPLVAPGTVDHHVADMAVTVAADVTLAALQASLAKHEQWLPIDGDADRPLGDLVLRNSTGPLRLGYGAWRDLLLGTQFLNGDGELITAGGRVVKNVAGYDLTKFIAGSYGCFGTPVTLTTRTYKRPAAAAQVTISPRPEIAWFANLLPTALRPTWAVMRHDALVMGYLGDAAAVKHFATAAAALEPREVRTTTLDQDVRERAKLWMSNRGAWRASVPPARVIEFVERANVEDWSAEPAFGIVVGRDPNHADRIRDAATRVGGAVTVMKADGTPIDISYDDAAYALLQRLKNAFDPNDRLPPLPPNRPNE